MAKLKRTHINSSLITSAGYDAFSEVMEIVFCNGGIYEYAQVSQDEYQAFLNADSRGEHFNNHIRNRKEGRYRQVRF